MRKDGIDTKSNTTRCRNKVGRLRGFAAALAVAAGVQTSAFALTLQIDVTDPSGTPVSGFRWLLEEGNTDQPIPGALLSNSLAVGIHKSHAPVFDSGRTVGSSATVEVPGDQPFFVSVLPDSGYTPGGARVEPGQTQVTVVVNPYPVPTAQISILAFKDTSPLNNAPELPVEEGLEGFAVIIHDAGGQQMMDAFGNPLGTKYVFDAGTGDPVMVDGAPVVEAMGNGIIKTDPFFSPSYSQTPFTFNFESGKTTYLDTPVIPVAAFAGFPNRPLDMEPPDGTPVIYSVDGQGQDSGPIICQNGRSIFIDSVGEASVPNPDYDPAVPGSPLTAVRDYGFGKGTGTVTLNGVPLATQSWNRNRIRIRVNNINSISTGQLIVTRGDNGLSTPIGITLHVGGCNAVVRVDAAGTWPQTPIQDAIDAAAPGALILVAPGYYKENPIIYKDVRLQGWGAGSTIINGNPVPFERVTAWHNKIDALMASGDLVPIDLEEAQRFFEATEAPCVSVNGVAETFDENSPGLIDGFSIMGGVAGGGVYLAAHADYMRVGNNKITNNQGTFGGGITVGQPGLDTLNDYVNIHHNTIAMNGGINGGGGLTLFTGADNYVVADNRILGNFSRNVGGGVAHIGLSDGGAIARNVVAFNEVFYGTLVGGDGAGIYLGGVLNPAALAELSAGAGSVSIVSNLIQGNLAGSGSGGGISALNFNGQDTAGLPADWYSLEIYNNVIVNNVAAFRGGAIALQDAANVSIIHNTIANNDCTATASLAFPPGTLTQSDPQGGGIVATQHSAALAAATGQTFSDPDLRNNVIWHNRSFSWDGTIQNIAPNTPAYWDLQVVGGGSMDPQYCVLTDTTGYASTNIAGNPAFVRQYDNNLLTAFVVDEGGNAVSVSYLELDLSLGDYHIGGGSSAVDAGGSFPAVPELDVDIDGDPRPTAGADIGADEVPGLARAKTARNPKG